MLALLASEANGACMADQPSLADISSDKRNTVEGPQSVAKLEKANLSQNRDTGKFVPFGYGNKEWNELKATMHPGDRIFFVTHRDGHFFADFHILVRGGVICSLMGAIS